MLKIIGEVDQGKHNAWFRMVIGYWDMAASLVTNGGIDGDAAHNENFATFSKIQPFIAELRSKIKEPELCRHIEAVVMAVPDAEAILYCGQLKAEAMRRGCKFVKLETFSFQAWDFYKKNGYTVFAELDQVVGDHRWYFLKKDLKA